MPEQEFIKFYKEGDQVCCTFHDFVDLQQSPAGFGGTPEEAFNSLMDDPACSNRFKQIFQGVAEIDQLPLREVEAAEPDQNKE